MGAGRVRIEAVLFDFGGVFTPSPWEAVRGVAEELGVAFDLALYLCFGEYGQDTDHPWHRLERGEISLEAARHQLRELAASHGVELDVFEALARLGGEDPQRELVVERVRALRARGYRTALVTNNVAEFGEGWRSLLPVDELFEVVVDSSRVGVRKPDPRILLRALSALGGVPPERAVLLDDHEANVSAARSIGMHGILVGPDRSLALQRLDALLDGG